MSRPHANTAEILRLLAASPQPELSTTLNDEAIRLALKRAAEACETVDQVERERDSAAMSAAACWSLLDRVATALDSQPSAADAGAWEAYMLADDIRRAHAAEPPEALQRLERERQTARRCIRAAMAMVVALRERDMARVRACIGVFEEANQEYEAVASWRGTSTSE